MTDVPGVLRDKNDIGTKIHELNIRQCRELIQDGIIAGGMIPKVGPGVSEGLRSTPILCLQAQALIAGHMRKHA